MTNRLTSRDYLLLLRRRLWIVVLAAFVCGATAYVTSSHIKPTYEATATLLVNATQAPNALTYTDVLLSQQLTKTYSEMAVDPVVLQAVLEQLKLPYTVQNFQKQVTATPRQDTQLIAIAAQGRSAAEAQQVANVVAQTFITQQQQRLASGAASNAISIVQPAILPDQPISPRIRLDTGIGVLAGGLLALGLITVVAFLDDTLKTQRDIESALNLPVLGLVPEGSGRLEVVVGAPANAQQRQAAEVFRMVRANLDFATANNDARIILVTSTQKGEGKTTTACGLAVALAEAGREVVLVDGDLRLPRIHRSFGLENRSGLTNLLVTSHAPLEDFLQATAIPTLRVLTSGATPPNSADLLQGQRMTALLSALGKLADNVIVDSPPVLAVADAAILASKVQGVLVVTASGQSRLARIEEALAILRRTTTPLLGVVLNKVSRDVDSYYGDRSYSAYVTADEATNHNNGSVSDKRGAKARAVDHLSGTG